MTAADVVDMARDGDGDGGGGEQQHDDDGFYYHTVEVDGITTTLRFKPLNQLPLGIVRKSRRDPQEQAWAPLEWALSEEDLALLDELPTTELEKITKGWQDHSETTLGESSGSTPSSSTGARARRSKRT